MEACPDKYAMTDDVTNWSDLREFKAVDLTRSFVLSWHLEGDGLVLDLDLCLGPEHAFYEAPRPSEEACIRPGELEFPYCTQLAAADSHAEVGAIGGLASRLGHGRISEFQRTGDGIYRMSGSFGTVVVHAERPILRLKTLML